MVAGAALGASTPFLLSAMICTNVSLILLTALASLSTERDPTSLDASHVFGASDVPGCSSRGTNAAPAAAAMPAAGEAVSSPFDGNPVGLDVNPVGPAWSIHGSTKLLTSSWWPSRSATARSSSNRCATWSCLLHSPKPSGSTKTRAEGICLPPSCGVGLVEEVMLSRMASHNLVGYRAAAAVLEPRGPCPRSC